MTNDFKTKMSVVYDSLVDRTDGAVVRCITPILKDKPEGLADEHRGRRKTRQVQGGAYSTEKRH